MKTQKKERGRTNSTKRPKKNIITTKPRSQADRILEYMMQDRPLTQKQAIQYWQCYRLSGRIHELRAQGYNIETTRMPNKNGGTHASYRLVK